MSNIRIQLLNIINRDTPDSTNFVIAKHILENLEAKKIVSVKELALNCNVSKSSISRFCRKIGYEDFIELQYAIASYHSFVNDRFPDLKENSTNSYIYNYLETTKEIVEYLEKYLDVEVLEGLAKDIHTYQRVILMGHVQSSLPAFSLQHYLTLLHKFVYSTQDLNEQKEMLENLDENNLIIIFSAGGKFLERVLDRMSVMDRESIARIYVVTANKSAHYSFVYKYIELWKSYNYVSSAILEMYSNLISLAYKKIYMNSDNLE